MIPPPAPLRLHHPHIVSLEPPAHHECSSRTLHHRHLCPSHPSLTPTRHLDYVPERPDRDQCVS